MTVDADREANRMLLAGEVGGALMLHFEECRFEVDDEGNYTGRTLIPRRSGVWSVTVEFLAEHDSEGYSRIGVPEEEIRE